LKWFCCIISHLKVFIVNMVLTFK